MHKDIIDAGCRMKIAYEDWQDNMWCCDCDDFKKDFESARKLYRSVKRDLEGRGIDTGLGY